jgi:hypothetical protein
MLKTVLSNLKDWLPIAVSSLALFLGLLSFWSMHWKKGWLSISVPRSFVTGRTNDRLIVELPLSFYNDGAAAIAVNNLLLEIKQESALALLRFEFTRPRLGDGAYEWARPFVVEGRGAFAGVFYFQAKPGELSPKMGSWDCRLLGQLGGSGTEFSTLLRFKLNVKQLGESMVAQDNFDEEYQKVLARRLRAR